MAKLIISSGHLDGLLSAAALKQEHRNTDEHIIHRMFTPKDLASKIQNTLDGRKPPVIIVDLPIKNSEEIVDLIESRPLKKTQIYNSQGNASQEVISLLEKCGINETVSSCENMVKGMNLEITPIIPAMASISKGFDNTEYVKKANHVYSQSNVDKNTRIIKYAFAMMAPGERLVFVNPLAEGILPEESKVLMHYYKGGLTRKYREKREIERVSFKKIDLAVAYLISNPMFPVEFAEHVAHIHNTEIGLIGVSNETLGSMNNLQYRIARNPRSEIDVGKIVDRATSGSGGYSIGNNKSAYASISGNPETFLHLLNRQI